MAISAGLTDAFPAQARRFRAEVERPDGPLRGLPARLRHRRQDHLRVENRYRAGPAGGGAADLHREAGDGEAVRGDGLEIVQLLEMAVADVAPSLVAFPDQAGIAGLGELFLGVDEGRVPAPAVRTGE